MRSTSLRIIEAFVRHGGTADAGQALGVSQSAVIKALHLAEAELDLDLIANVQGRLVPTPEARALGERAGGAFDALLRARHEADMIRVGMAGRLRIATTPSLAHSILPSAVTATRKQSGDTIAIEIVFDRVAERLTTGDVDIGLSYGRTGFPGLVDIVVRETALVCVLPPGHALASSRRVRPSDLHGERLISYAPTKISEEDSFSAALSSVGLASTIAISVRHTDMACDFARQGLCIAIVDGFAIGSMPASDLVSVPLTGAHSVTAFAHHRAGVDLDTATILLLSELQETAWPR